MAQRHKDRKQYFNEQAFTTKKYVIPFIEKTKKISSDVRVLEIGCGEGGNMKPFLELGCEVYGIDINEKQLDRARDYYRELGLDDRLTLIHKDIYEVSPETIGQFDVIMLRDVIEHIPNQEKFLAFLPRFMKDDGVTFFGFPPWHMPFGGHQQMCRSKLGKLPWIHLLPRGLYAKYLRAVGESDHTVESRLEIYDTGITIDRFFKIIKTVGLQVRDKQMYLFNPNYEVKFNLRPIHQIWPLDKIPWIRNFYTTCCYAVIGK